MTTFPAIRLCSFVDRAIFHVLLILAVLLGTTCPLSGQIGKVHFHRKHATQEGATAYSRFSGRPHLMDVAYVQPPPAAAHIYLFTVGMSGRNTGGTSILIAGASNGTSTVQTDSIGNYILTDSGGTFDLGGLYAAACPANSPQAYLMATGGSSGGLANNPYSVEIAAMPVSCSSMPNLCCVGISEATTAAAAFALAAFADTSDDGLSTTPDSASALADAFAYANSLAAGAYPNIPGVPTTAPGFPVNNSQTVTDIDTVADVLGACLNSDGDSNSPCPTLMSYTTITGTPAPVDLWQAVLSMAEHPTNNLQNLIFLTGATDPYQPQYTSVPTSWQLGINGA